MGMQPPEARSASSLCWDSGLGLLTVLTPWGRQYRWSSIREACTRANKSKKSVSEVVEDRDVDQLRLAVDLIMIL